ACGRSSLRGAADSRHPPTPIPREVVMNTSKQNPELAATENTGRDAQGRFSAGNTDGPGNPYGRRVAELRKIMLECVTDAEMRIIVGELMVQAKMGKLAAIKLLFQYLLG